MADPTWRLRVRGKTRSITEPNLRQRLRTRSLSGIELCRHERDDQWRALHDTHLFREEVAHLGDPAVAAHRRRLWRWVPPVLPLLAWIAFFGGLLASVGPDGSEIVPLTFLLVGLPSMLLLAWTALFFESLYVAVGGRRARAEAPPKLLPESLDEEVLRAQREVDAALRALDKS